MECGYQVVIKNGQLYYIDEQGKCIPFIIQTFSPGRGRSSRTAKINVQNQGIAIGQKSTFNFTGPGVNATNVGNGQVDIYIPAGCLTDVTYDELLALIVGNGLEAGCFYCITDFQTVHIIPNTAIVHEGTIEPIIVQANTTNSIHTEAISTIFDSAEIFYEVVDSTTSGGNKGRIWDMGSQSTLSFSF